MTGNHINIHPPQIAKPFNFLKWAVKAVRRLGASLDIFWLKDDSLADSDSLPDPAILARVIVESLESALEQFRCIEDELREES